MPISKMVIVNFIGEIQNLNRVIDKYCIGTEFQPEPAPDYLSTENHFSPLMEKNPCAALLNQYSNMAVLSGIELKYAPKQPDETLSVEETQHFIAGFQNQFNELGEQKRAVSETIAQYQQAIIQVSKMIELNVSFDEIFASRFIKTRFGRISDEGYQKLLATDSSDFLFFPLSSDNGYNWGVYFTSEPNSDVVDAFLQSIFFERIRIPDYIHGTPSQGIVALKKDLEQEQKKLAEVLAKIKAYVEDNTSRFLSYYSFLKQLDKLYEVRKFASVYGHCFYLYGWMPENKAIKLVKHAQKDPHLECLIDYDLENYGKPPTLMKNNSFDKPFELFVEMYGLPSYGEIDPTPLVAITYTILFGIMFGDVGQGLVISLVGWIMYKLMNMGLGRILFRIGFSSCFFGLIYGSVFGDEEILNGFYTNVLGLNGKPFDVMDPGSINIILLSAVGLGVFLILTAMVCNLISAAKQKRILHAVFDHNGIAGIIFFASAISMLVLYASTDFSAVNRWVLAALLIVPFITMFFKEPLERAIEQKKKLFVDGVGNFLMLSFFEMLEILLSYVSNTMSFLRVGAFVLSHAGMMSVVTTLAGMSGGAAKIAILVIGNLFVIAMEGLVVGIQVLRLEFYEIFSRFFDGTGRPFSPIVIKY